MEDYTGPEERRKFPRLLMDLPLEYRVTNAPYAHGGIVANASEDGFLIYSIKDVPVGAKLTIVVMFPKGYELTNFEVVAEVVRKDLHWEEDWEGFAYGLKFIHILEEDREKLRQLLAGQSRMGEVVDTP